MPKIFDGLFLYVKTPEGFLILLGIVVAIYFGIKQSTPKKEKISSIVSPVFYSLGEKYRVDAVHEYVKSNEVSGYTWLGQNSRHDQWNKLIKINSTLFNLRHEIVPLDKNKILRVIISRNGKEVVNSVHFNN